MEFIHKRLELDFEEILRSTSYVKQASRIHFTDEAEMSLTISNNKQL